MFTVGFTSEYFITFEQHEQGPKTPRPITGNLYGVGTELWGEAINIALNRCHFFKKKTLIFLPPPGPYPLSISSRSRDGNPGP